MSARGQDRSSRLAALSVEPLSDLSWQRVERRLFADGAIPTQDAGAAPARGRRWKLAAGASMVAAAAALLVLLWPRGDREVARVDDSEPVRGADTAPRPPSRIVTADARSSVSVGDVALDVAARSALLVDSNDDGGVLVVLERGEVDFRVAPRGARPPVVVHAGDARVEVVGTAFTVTRVGDSARVAVHEGAVEVMAHGRRARVAAGQTWSGDGAGASVPPAAPEPETDDRAGGDRREDRAWPRPQRRREKGTRAQAGAASRAKAGTGAPPQAPAGSTATAIDERALYERAARMEASRPQAALAIYDQLAAGRGPWAANALFAQARLELELGHRERARRLLASYLARHPGGANAEDARQLLDRLH